MYSQPSASDRSPLEGLWVLLVNENDRQVPMVARAGDDQTFLLGFKNVVNARRFLAQSPVQNAEPRMVVKGNKQQVIQLAHDAGAAHVLVDYDPTTNGYASATELY